jgi:hypothetical protein
MNGEIDNSISKVLDLKLPKLISKDAELIPRLIEVL